MGCGASVAPTSNCASCEAEHSKQVTSHAPSVAAAQLRPSTPSSPEVTEPGFTPSAPSSIPVPMTVPRPFGGDAFGAGRRDFPHGKLPEDTAERAKRRGWQAVRRILWALANGSSASKWPQCVWEALEDFSCLNSLAEDVQDRMQRTMQAMLPESKPENVDTALAPGCDIPSIEDALVLDSIVWEEFAVHVFEEIFLDVLQIMSPEGKVAAEDVMLLLELLSRYHAAADEELRYEDAELIVREFDTSCDGVLSKADFLSMVRALDEADYPDELKDPHLVLHFDVNNTVLIRDSVSNQSPLNLITLTLASYCWGTKTRRKNGNQSWIMVSKEPAMLPPWAGLVSYADFVVEEHPFPEGCTFDEKEEIRARRRAKLHSFVEPGSPGETLRPFVGNLAAALQLPENLVNTPAALNAGLSADTVQLLPSFLHFLRELKRTGRTFTVIFRSFGTDLGEMFEKEFNALCEGRHPLFAGGPVLDGSDGGPDHRMHLEDTTSLGTFFRSPKDGDLSLVWGTHKQPKPGHGLEFYESVPTADVHEGTEAAAKSFFARVAERSQTVVLRDYYPGWARANFKGCGGKPVFIQIEDTHVLPVFFDDHLRPVNPTIVDPIDVRVFPVRLPMQQVYHRHLVRASPLRSIVERSYFLDEVARCERNKAEQLALRSTVGRLLHDPKAVREVIKLLGGEEEGEQDVVGAMEEEATVDSSQVGNGIAPPPPEEAPPSAPEIQRQVSKASRISQVSERSRTSSGRLRQALHYTPWKSTEEAVANARCTLVDIESLPVDRMPNAGDTAPAATSTVPT
eukprot:TRINITY_DN34488_c0_g1_i1.p1 TRINITY_DN34488_c0_g1~~TRINITY_DN34488_c0_g1_i1.p1  ORF type:complete len:797 (+),score=153.57 TRINITY_DN34488_c0_g1_i1:134-2524(+)